MLGALAPNQRRAETSARQPLKDFAHGQAITIAWLQTLPGKSHLRAF